MKHLHIDYKETPASGQSEGGFTLIELSIVLVIIGLIVGGILVGQDLINAAGIRATVAQVEKYNSAVNTFRTKYNGIPGDLAQATAAQFGLFAVTTAAAGMEDGNGLVEGGSAGATVPIGETIIFWNHLSQANLADGSFGAATAAVINAGTGKTTGNVTSPAQSLPPTKASNTNYFTVYANNGLNYFQILPIATVTSAGAYTYGTAGLTPIQAQNIDQKMDDGSPNTGIVLARAVNAVDAVPTAARRLNSW